MRDEEALLREAVARLCTRAVTPHVEALEHHPDTGVPAEVLAAVAELDLESIDTATEEGRRLLCAGLGALGERSAAVATLALARAVARALAGPAAPEGPGAVPLYAELPEAEPCPTGRVEGEELLLDGRLEMMVGAQGATFLLVPFQSGSDGPRALALVPTGTHGLHVEAPLLTLGMRGCSTSDVTLHGLRVPAAAVIPFDPEVLARFRGPVCAISAALCRGSFEAALAYARERQQGGQPIIEHGEVRAMLSDLEADAAVCAQASWALCADPEPVGLMIRGRELAARATSDGVQLLGGYGYMEDYGQERRMRDARQACYLLGRGEVLRQRSITLRDESPAAPPRASA